MQTALSELASEIDSTLQRAAAQRKAHEEAGRRQHFKELLDKLEEYLVGTGPGGGYDMPLRREGEQIRQLLSQTGTFIVLFQETGQVPLTRELILNPSGEIISRPRGPGYESTIEFSRLAEVLTRNAISFEELRLRVQNQARAILTDLKATLDI